MEGGGGLNALGVIDKGDVLLNDAGLMINKTFRTSHIIPRP